MKRSGDREFNSNTARDLCKRLLEYAIHNVDPKACEILAEVNSMPRCMMLSVILVVTCSVRVFYRSRKFDQHGDV